MKYEDTTKTRERREGRAGSRCRIQSKAGRTSAESNDNGRGHPGDRHFRRYFRVWRWRIARRASTQQEPASCSLTLNVDSIAYTLRIAIMVS
jgi:hypothetical protein